MEKIAVAQFIPKEFRTSQALKTLRTNLMFSGDAVRAIGMTSFGAAEGKSIISFQTAMSFAQAGKRVLLIDADLHKSVLPGCLHIENEMDGLSHYLSGSVDISQLLCQTDLPGLYILFAGASVSDSAELLGGEKFARLIPSLKEMFDYIIVDTAPLGRVIDCAVMASVLDGIVMVVDATDNSYKLERRIKAQLERARGKILGVVLNRAELSDRRCYL